MSYGLVGLYALYMIFVGANRNAGPLLTAVEADAKGFAPWLLAILVLKGLDDVDTLRPVVTPFIGLAVLTFALKNYGTLSSQVSQVTGFPLPGVKAP